jgi:hypothetical protein
MIAEAVAYYDQLLTKKHFATTYDHLSRAIERHRLYSKTGQPICSVLRPHILDRAAEERIRRAAVLVNSAVIRVADKLLADPVLAKAAGLPKYFEPIFTVDRAHPRPPLMSRIDGFLDAAGEIRFIEYNGGPVLVAEDEELAAAFTSMPIALEFAKRFPFRVAPMMEALLAATYAAHETQGGRGAPTIAAIRTKTRLSRELGYLAWRGCRVVHVSMEELTERSGELFVRDLRIDFVHFGWSELLDLLHVQKRGDGADALLSALRADKVRLISGCSRGLLSSAKILFEILSDPSNTALFDREVAAALARHIPWTRRVRDCRTSFKGRTIDLVPFVQGNRDAFVIKPSGGSEGEGVALGWDCDQNEWEKTLRLALVRPYVVQERVPVPTQSFPAIIDGKLEMVDRLMDLNPYVWNGEQVLGQLTRIAPRGKLNLGAADASGSMTAGWTLE